MNKKLSIGLIINPIAGVGGTVALKGSDLVVSQALALGAVPMANQRTMVALKALLPYKDTIRLLTVNGEMGQSACEQLGLSYELVYQTSSAHTSAQDSREAAKQMIERNVDLLLFAGGDGTARDICAMVDAQRQSTLVLGIPAGCKIHSGIYAVTPRAAGQVLAMMASGQMLSVHEGDVMDIDEQAFRQGVVRARLYGHMPVLGELRYIQATKMGGLESDELVLQDIADYVIEQMEPQLHYIMGSGSTVAFIMQALGLENTLLGVDVVCDHQVTHQDVSAQSLLALAKQVGRANIRLLITVIGGQGHILGRGNQQLSAQLIRFIGKENIIVVASKNKLKGLNGRPLLVDSGDETLNDELAGMIKVITGYNDHVMYPLAS